MIWPGRHQIGMVAAMRLEWVAAFVGIRRHVHYTPTSASWINQVERFFGLLTDNSIRRGAHHSTAELEAAIPTYIDARNADPKPFRWTKTADDILASIERFCLSTIEVQKRCG